MPDRELTLTVKMGDGMREAIRRDMLQVLNEMGDGHDLQLLTERRVAKILGVSTAYVRKHLVKAGHLKSVTLPSGDRRIPLKSLQELVDRLLAEGGGE